MNPLVRLGVAAGCSNLADGVFQVALPLVALGITRDPGAFAAVTLVGRLPWLLFALPAGALADRLDRRRTMTLVNLARAGLIGALALLVATDHEGLWALYVIGFALGVGETLFDTASQSILPAVVSDKDRLATANGRLYAVEMAANQFVGPPLGAVVVAASAAAALTGSAVAYLLAALALTTLAGDFRTARTGPPTRLRADVAEGVRYLFGHPLLRTLALCVGLSNLASTAAFAVFPLYAVGDDSAMGLSEAGFGALLTTSAIGMLAASPFVDRIERRVGTFPALFGAIALFPVWSLAPALTTAWPAVAVASVVTGLSNVVWNVLTVSLRQRITPDALLGRMNAGYRLLAWGTMPLGALLGGLVGEVLGLRGVFWVATALSAACLPLFLSGVSARAIADARAEAADREDAGVVTEPPRSVSRRRRRRWIALGVVGGVGLAAAGAVAATWDAGPTARERSRAATERPCGRGYVELEAQRLDKPAFALVGVGRAEQPSTLAVDPRGERPTLLGEREGRVLFLDDEDDITAEVALDLGDTSDHGDGGLLGLVYDPDGEWLYALRATADQDDVLTAYPLFADGRPDQDGEVELLRSGHPPSEQHHGGGLAFGPDGFLYVSLGDGGGLGDPNGNAQDRGTLLGKVLRIDPTPDAADPYRIPPGNPYGDEIWAVGVRNPYRLSFDERTGDLWLGDVGQSCWEELNRLPPAGGANLGWDRYEGSTAFEGGDVGTAAVWPEHTYAHRAGWCALVLGYVVREPSLPELDGWLLHTDYCRGRVHAFRPGVAVGDPPRLVDTGLRVERPISVVEGPDGMPWILSLEGEIFAIRPR